jgi:uncharacterized protein YbbC (DUF1343 family)
MGSVGNGLDVLQDEYGKRWKGLRIGLLSNQASLNNRLKHAKTIINELMPGQLTALFGPQHGVGGEDQDNMIETPHRRDRGLDVPVFSLYAEKREPEPYMMDLVDVLIIDLQDVGTRVYTFSATMLNCLRAAARSGKKVVILDRPNPLGGIILEGNLLEQEMLSFVGPYRLPMRHGLTMGEMGRMFNHGYRIHCDLEIVPMAGWRRGMLWKETGLRWVMPSPNMPLPETAAVYPGQVLWEGTNCSEGRGTCRPFEIFGSPYFEPEKLRSQLGLESLAGCRLQDFTFRPTYHKWSGNICRGFMIHVEDPQRYRPYFTSLAILQVVMRCHGDQFSWKQPPYEYEFEKMPIDLILGSTTLRQTLEQGVCISEVIRGWDDVLKEYEEWREPFLLYH